MKEKIKITCFMLIIITLITIVIIYHWSVHRQYLKEYGANSAILDYVEFLERELFSCKDMYQERLEKCPITNEELAE